MEQAIVRKEIYYFPSFLSALYYARAHKLPIDRIIAYQLGWAIQKHKSGPYYGPMGWN